MYVFIKWWLTKVKSRLICEFLVVIARNIKNSAAAAAEFGILTYGIHIWVVSKTQHSKNGRCSVQNLSLHKSNYGGCVF